MAKSFLGLLVSLLLVAAAGIVNEQGAYCDGFRQGYRSVVGEHGRIDSCPAVPSSPSPGAGLFERGVSDGAAWAEERE